LEAAHVVYHQFWGNDINELLQPVPGYPDVKYLPTKYTAPLRSSLLYGPVILLVREEYKTLYNNIWSYKKFPERGGVVVSGQPGIGMHILLTGLLR
jgi:hypothetical protein